MTIPSTPYGGAEQWGTILQQPYLNVDVGGPVRRRGLWSTRQGEMNSAQAEEMAALTAALQAERDQKMAELAAQDAARGSGGGGGRGGGGGGSTGTLLSTIPVPDSNWYDQLAGYYGQQTAPPTYTRTMPSDIDPTHVAWYVNQAPKPAPGKVSGTGTTSYQSRAMSVAHPLGVGILPKMPKQTLPTKYLSRLS